MSICGVEFGVQMQAKCMWVGETPVRVCGTTDSGMLHLHEDVCATAQLPNSFGRTLHLRHVDLLLCNLGTALVFAGAVGASWWCKHISEKTVNLVSCILFLLLPAATIYTMML
jgi:hypothetical protein